MPGNRDGLQIGRSNGFPQTPSHTGLVLKFVHDIIKNVVLPLAVVLSAWRPLVLCAVKGKPFTNDQ